MIQKTTEPSKLNEDMNSRITQQEMDFKRKAMMNISFTGQKDMLSENAVQRLSTQGKRQGVAISVMKYYFTKYDIPELEPVLDDIVLYSSYTKPSLKVLTEFKKFASLFDLFSRGGGNIRKEA